jgi:N-acyl amino acid synthase of PEP-CTERM/exosortase system
MYISAHNNLISREYKLAGNIKMTDLCEIFNLYFDVITDDELGVLDEALRLRYQVYCVEHDFEDSSHFKDGMESDDYDCRSVHGIVCHRSSGVTAATVRLVLPDMDNPEVHFPIEKNCSDSLVSAPLLLKGIPRQSIAEISRFAVSKNFKRRLGEAGSVAGIGPDHEKYVKQDPSGKRVIPHLIVGLFVAIVKLSAEHHITHWYAVMDVSLLRLLNRFGINFMSIGAPVDYHGLRQPCFGRIDDVLAGIWNKRFDIWQLITADGAVWPAPEKPESRIVG